MQMLVPGGNCIFQDYDPEHSARIDKEWVRNNAAGTCDRPVNLPIYLTPIENLLTYLDRMCADSII